MRRSAAPLLTLGLGLLAAASFGGSPASAEPPSQSGWWTSSNPGSVMGSPTPPPPPDVPSKGLLVEGGASSTSGASDSGPSAFAALEYDLPDGATPGDLTLTVAPGSGSTPTAQLQLCQLTTGITAEDNGPMQDAPSFDCKTNVTASPSSSGNTYTFKVEGFVSDGTLAVAILPTSPIDRVVLSHPDANSLPVEESAVQVPSDGAPSTALGGSGGPTAVSSGTASNVTALPGAEAVPSAGPSLATQPPSATAQQASPSGKSASEAQQFAVSANEEDSKANPIAVGLVSAALVLGGAVWLAVGRSAARRTNEVIP